MTSSREEERGFNNDIERENYEKPREEASAPHQEESHFCNVATRGFFVTLHSMYFILADG